MKKKMAVAKEKKERSSEATNKEVVEDVAPLKRKSEKKKKRCGHICKPEGNHRHIKHCVTTTQTTKKSKKAKKGLRCLKKDARLIISAKNFNKKMREKEIEQGELKLLEARKEEEERHIAAMAAEFKRKLHEESDTERLSKAQCIKKNVKKEGKKKEKRKLAKGIAKSKAKLLEKRNEIKEVTK